MYLFFTQRMLNDHDLYTVQIRIGLCKVFLQNYIFLSTVILLIVRKKFIHFSTALKLFTFERMERHVEKTTPNLI